jgi:hypothetical protein
MSTDFAITARGMFDSSVPGNEDSVATWRDLRVRSYLRLLREFYRDPLAWVGLFVAMLALGYLGGAVMFVLHAEVLGELGPAINPVQHWILDSTLGFVGLAPVAAFILPAAACVATSCGRLRAGLYATVGGVLFAFATAPGPFAHDMLVGRGTWLANHVALWLNSGTSMAGMPGMKGDNVSAVVSVGSQVMVGIPTYIFLVWLSLIATRAVLRTHRAVGVRRTRRTPAHALAK